MRLFILTVTLGGAFLSPLIIAGSAVAMEDVFYAPLAETVTTQTFYTWLQNAAPQLTKDSLVGEIDLNNDGMNEFILRQCSAPSSLPAPCLHTVFAASGGQYVKLAEISTLRLAVSNASAHGVRHLVSYNNPANDYGAIVYLWDAGNSRYIKE